jgi:hypothetical protein
MIHAEIQGKAHNPEDVLTSNVFGLLRLLPKPYVARVLNPHIERALGTGYLLSEEGDIEVQLWKHLPYENRWCEPDVLLLPQDGRALAVEVKYGTDESSDNQLLKYFESVRRLYPKAEVLLYLTDDREKPQSVLDKYPQVKIAWLSWYDLFETVSAICVAESNECHRRILDAVLSYLEFKGFSSFRGWDIKPISRFSHFYLKRLFCFARVTRVNFYD